MAERNFAYLTTVQLKEYLRERGITTSNYNKLNLVRLAETANELNLDTNEEDDYIDTNENRRTLTSSDASDGRQVQVILPEVTKISKWSKDFSTLPNIEMGDIFVYLITECQWDSDRIKRYKDDNSYKLFKQNHIDNVMISPVGGAGDVQYMYIKSTCVPETRQHDQPYQSWILVNDNGYVKSGGCTCVADDGSCKHCVSLLFAIQAFIDRHKDRGIEVGTDRICAWDKPRQVSTPATVKELQFRKKGDVCDDFRPVSNEPCMTKDEVSLSLYRACKNYGSVYLHTVDFSSDEENEIQTTDAYPYLPEILSNFHQSGDASDESLLEHLRSAHTEDYIKFVENATKDQTESIDWFNYRKGRITASVMGSVLNCRMDKLVPNNYIVKKIYNYEQCSFSTPATLYGKAMESVALSQYTLQYKNEHIKMNVEKCGLFISNEYPFIGGSPDAVVDCKCCGNGIVEIKCSFSNQYKTPFEVAEGNDYHIFVEDGKIILKRSSPWYAQIQTQLYAANVRWCDFVFFTRKGIAVERIEFNSDFFNNCLSKAKQFFFKFLKNV